MASCILGAFLGRVLLTLGFVLTLADWLDVHSFWLHWCRFCHSISRRDSSLNKSFALLPQMLEGILSVSSMSRVLAWCKFPKFVCLDFSYIVFYQCDTVEHQQFCSAKAWFLFWVPSGHWMTFDVYEVTNFNFFLRSCNHAVNIRLLLLSEIFSLLVHVSHALNLKDTFCSMY